MITNLNNNSNNNYNNNSNNNINDLINTLKPYMFMDINHHNIYKLQDNTDKEIMLDNKDNKKYKIQAPFFERNPDYNKERRKYNEKIISNNSNKNKDPLFWCFYKIFKKLEDNDLQYINIFVEEKNNKIKFVQELEGKKDILKKFKIKHSILKDELSNDTKITLYTFKSLFILYDLNVIVLKDNFTFSGFFSNKEYNDLFLNNLDLNNLESELKFDNIIKLNYNNSAHISNNYEIIMDIKINNENIIKLMKSSYYIENLEKPLKSESSYKLQDLINISNKLKIDIIDTNNKKKTKKSLYSEIYKLLS